MQLELKASFFDTLTRFGTWEDVVQATGLMFMDQTAPFLTDEQKKYFSKLETEFKARMKTEAAQHSERTASPSFNEAAIQKAEQNLPRNYRDK